MKVQEAGFQVAAVVLRKANDNTCRNEGAAPRGAMGLKWPFRVGLTWAEMNRSFQPSVSA